MTGIDVRDPILILQPHLPYFPYFRLKYISLAVSLTRSDTVRTDEIDCRRRR